MRHFVYFDTDTYHVPSDICYFHIHFRCVHFLGNYRKMSLCVYNLDQLIDILSYPSVKFRYRKTCATEDGYHVVTHIADNGVLNITTKQFNVERLR